MTPTRAASSSALRGVSPTLRPASPVNSGHVVPRAFATAANARQTPAARGALVVHNGARGAAAAKKPVGGAAQNRRPSELELTKRDLEDARVLIDTLRRQGDEDAMQLDALSKEKEDVEGELAASKEQVARLDQENEEKRAALARERQLVETLQFSETTLKGEVNDLQRRITIMTDEHRMAQENAERRITAITEASNKRMAEAEACIASLQNTIRDLQGKVHEQQATMVQMQKEKEREQHQLEMYLREGEIERMNLHNLMQEMKGNIRVFCRVRPLIEHDDDFRNAAVDTRTLAARRLSVTTPGVEYITFPDRVDHRRISVMMPNNEGTDLKDYHFQFDKVFEPAHNQVEIFDEIQHLVQSALDGYKVCIFAYGQTGSGKTYTMEGPSIAAMERDPSLQGMIPRAVEQIFAYGQKMRAKGWTYSLSVSFVEIYNEQIRDLLNSSEAYQDGPQTFQDGKCRHEIRNVDGYTILTGVTEVPVDDAKTVHTLLNISARNRKSSMTAMNDRASRSHSVFSLKIVGQNEGSQQQVLGVLNLIDLAGSERVALSGAEGERLKETAHINKSLSCLGDVIVALAKGDAHVPFRNSKLTHMLQPYMGNESKTLMFVNVSPSELFLNETLNSLRFAAKVNACEIGLAKKKISSKK